jgi:hypothetical protein
MWLLSTATPNGWNWPPTKVVTGPPGVSGASSIEAPLKLAQ